MTASEHPIPFSGPIVRAIMEGRKTQTRRVVRTLPNGLQPNCFIGMSGDRWCFTGGDRGGAVCGIRCPFGVPGDRLWVRETWRRSYGSMETHYRADPDEPEAEGCWSPSIFMPRSASRLTLEVLAVRVERLQEISEEDARAEGFGFRAYVQPVLGAVGEALEAESFSGGWDQINGKRAPWASNPWVWVVTFRRITP